MVDSLVPEVRKPRSVVGHRSVGAGEHCPGCPGKWRGSRPRTKVGGTVGQRLECRLVAETLGTKELRWRRGV